MTVDKGEFQRVGVAVRFEGLFTLVRGTQWQYVRMQKTWLCSPVFQHRLVTFLRQTDMYAKEQISVLVIGYETESFCENFTFVSFRCNTFKCCDTFNLENFPYESNLV